MNPFELADYVGFAAALVAGVWVGKKSRPKPPAPIKPICSCGHGWGTHKDGKRCDGVNEGYRNALDVIDPCPCQSYDGPDPAIFGLTS